MDFHRQKTGYHDCTIENDSDIYDGTAIIFNYIVMIVIPMEVLKVELDKVREVKAAVFAVSETKILDICSKKQHNLKT